MATPRPCSIRPLTRLSGPLAFLSENRRQLHEVRCPVAARPAAPLSRYPMSRGGLQVDSRTGGYRWTLLSSTVPMRPRSCWWRRVMALPSTAPTRRPTMAWGDPPGAVTCRHGKLT